MNDKFLFSISVADIGSERPISKATFDADGYCWHPLAVINHHTENRTFYQPEDFLFQFTNKDGIFYKNLTRGFLYGEENHPKIKKIPDDIPRLLTVEGDRVCVHTREIKTTKYPGMPNAYLIYGLIKPYGPFGHMLKDGLESPYINTAFSLRSLVKETYDKPRDLMIRKIIQLVTFDHVTVPGSYEASKRWSNIGIESYCQELAIQDFMSVAQEQRIPLKVVGQEKFVPEGDLRDFLGAVEIKMSTVDFDLTGFATNQGNIINPDTGCSTNLLHTLLKSKGGI